MQTLLRCIAILFALVSAQIGAAQELNVPGKLLAEIDAPAPGSNVTLAFLFEPKAGWHGYWENPGDAGLGLQLEWKLPAGITAATPRFPVPKPLLIGGLMNHVYEDPHAILVDLRIDRTVRAGTNLPVEVSANWLACTDTICVPQQGTFTLQLVAGNGEIDPAGRRQFDKWRSAIPVPLDQPARFAIKGKSYQIAIPYPASAPLDRPYFFVKTLDRIRYAAPQTARRNGNWLIIETEAQGASGPVEGLLRIGDGQGLAISTVAGDIPDGGSKITALGATDKLATTERTLPSLPWLLFGALLGGFLLNLMPCVFPILGLKALTLAKAGGDEIEARLDALTYTAGVVLSCLALGAALLSLRAAGEEIGWAFQLQEPAIVYGLLLLMVAVTANLAGLFEIPGMSINGNLARQPGLLGSFGTGVLAAFVATPCTGPFMAAAMGAAILLPTAEAMFLFGALGIGIALPFILIAYVPRLRALLPRPGPWLGRFRLWMAVPMGLTALALSWLLWRQTGMTGLWIGTVSAALLLVLLTTYRALYQRRGLALSLLLFGSVALVGFGAQMLPETDADRNAAQAAFPGAMQFDAARLSQLRASGAPVFLYFTADWCVTCKVNEAAAINREETVALFKAKNIKVMVGDFTRRDPAIARFLAQHGRSGVPLYLYYPTNGEPRELPQLLTVDILSEAIES